MDEQPLFHHPEVAATDSQQTSTAPAGSQPEPARRDRPVAPVAASDNPPGPTPPDQHDGKTAPPTPLRSTAAWVLRSLVEGIQQATGRWIACLRAPRADRGSKDKERASLVQAVRTPIAGCRMVAVASTKGGVGKTTTAVNLGHMLARHRGGRIIALDAAPEAGSLAYRIDRRTTATAADLLADLHTIHRYVDLRGYTFRADSGLEVLAAPTDLTADPSADPSAHSGRYRQLLNLLGQFHELIIVDCGTGIRHPTTQSVLAAADELVVVTGTSRDEARATNFLLDWLEVRGDDQRVTQAVAVINGVRGWHETEGDLEAVADHFARRCHQTVAVPFDQTLAGGSLAGLSELSEATTDAYLELAAAVATRLGETPPPPSDTPDHAPQRETPLIHPPVNAEAAAHQALVLTERAAPRFP